MRLRQRPSPKRWRLQVFTEGGPCRQRVDIHPTGYVARSEGVGGTGETAAGARGHLTFMSKVP